MKALRRRLRFAGWQEARRAVRFHTCPRAECTREQREQEVVRRVLVQAAPAQALAAPAPMQVATAQAAAAPALQAAAALAVQAAAAPAVPAGGGPLGCDNEGTCNIIFF